MSNTPRIALGTAALVTILCVPFLLGVAVIPKDPAERRQRVAALSAEERQQLNGKFDQFLKTTPAERARLIQIEETVSKDSLLKTTFDDFDQWFKTLSPWDRQRFLQESDPLKKKALAIEIRQRQREKVEKLREEQKRLDTEWEQALNENLSGIFGGRKAPINRLRSASLSDMMTVLKDSLPAGAIDAAKLSAMSPPEQNIEILTAALKDRASQTNFRREPLPKDVVEKMTAQIQNERFQEFLNRDTENGGRMFVSMLARSIEQQWWDAARRHRPSRGQLEQTVEKLSPSMRREFERKLQQDPKTAYIFLHVARKGADFRQTTRELHSLLTRIGVSRGRRRP